MIMSKKKVAAVVEIGAVMPQSLLVDKDINLNRLVVVFRKDRLEGDDGELGRKLLVPYLEALLRLSEKPRALLFYNTGVRLLTEHSEAIKLLSKFEKEGCELLACNLSLMHLGLSGSLLVGEISTQEIMLERQIKADKILWP